MNGSVPSIVEAHITDSHELHIAQPLDCLRRQRVRGNIVGIELLGALRL